MSTSSNHPDSVLSKIQEGVCKRLSFNSSDAEKFHHHSAHFDIALKEAGHPGNMEYIPNIEHGKRKNRQRKVIWFNPPWCRSVRTNIAGKFLKLVRKHFSKGSPLYHLFNVKKLKVSYSTGPNMKQLITGNNKKVIAISEGRVESNNFRCNCVGGVRQCPLGGQCQVESLVYQATVTMDGEQKTYVGQTKNSFKSRVTLHNSDNNCGRKRTGLNTYIIEKKSCGEEPSSIDWCVMKRAKQRKRGDRLCQLCLTEKVFILRSDPSMTLNKRSELMQRCRHRDELWLSNYHSHTMDRGRGRRRLQTVGVLQEDRHDSGEEYGRDIQPGESLEEDERLEEDGGQSGRDVEGLTRTITDEEGGPSGGQRRLRRQTMVDYRVFF